MLLFLNFFQKKVGSHIRGSRLQERGIFGIYDLRFWIYDYFDPKTDNILLFSDQNNRKS